MMLGHRIYGSGSEPVIVMHDWLGDHMNYASTLPFWDRSNFTWVFVDLRGYGLSRHIRGDFTCREATADVISVADSLGFDRFNLVGHSMSSMIAQSIATRVPGRVESVIAVTPLAATGMSMSPEVKEFWRIMAMDCLSVLENEHSGVHGRYKDPWLELRLRSSDCCSTREARAGYMNMFTGTDFSEEAAGLPVPVRAIVGERDIPVFQREAVSRAFTKLYPDFQIAECRESGHYPMIQSPRLFVSKVEKFLLQSRRTGFCGEVRHPYERKAVGGAFSTH